MTLISIAFLIFNSLSFVLHQKVINNYIMKIINLRDNNIASNEPQIEYKNNFDTSKVNKKQKTKNKKNGKNKKRKKKKSHAQPSFPPKNSKNKRINEKNDKGVESSINNLNRENINFNKNKKNEINDIIISPNINSINNNIKSEKVIIDSNKELEKIKDEKNVYENIDIKKLNDQEINDLKYEIALKIDKRSYFEYYWSLLKKKHLILFTFWHSNDYNIYTIKVSLFLLSFELYISINGFFFSDDTMHKLYEDKGKYNILYRIPQILFSTIISAVINVLLKKLSLTEANLLSIKEEKDDQKILEKSKSIKKCLRIKFIIYFIISILFMLFFWYFISCFCAVYKNTQLVLIKDTLVSYALSMVYPFGLNLLPGLFRIPALKAEKGDKVYRYKLSQLVAFI